MRSRAVSSWARTGAGRNRLRCSPSPLTPLPPGGERGWGEGGDSERDLLDDGEPLHLVVVADTSASMDTHQRAVQANFVSALFGCLTPSRMKCP